MATAALGSHPESRAELLTKLGQRGYTPAGRDQSAVPYRVIEEALYRVAGGFPRLTRSSFPDGLPAGVSRVSYQLDMTACQDWLVAGPRIRGRQDTTRRACKQFRLPVVGGGAGEQDQPGSLAGRVIVDL